MPVTTRGGWVKKSWLSEEYETEICAMITAFKPWLDRGFLGQPEQIPRCTPASSMCPARPRAWPRLRLEVVAQQTNKATSTRRATSASAWLQKHHAKSVSSQGLNAVDAVQYCHRVKYNYRRHGIAAAKSLCPSGSYHFPAALVASVSHVWPSGQVLKFTGAATNSIALRLQFTYINLPVAHHQSLPEHPIHPSDSEYGSLKRANEDSISRPRVQHTEQDCDLSQDARLVVDLCEGTFREEILVREVPDHVGDALRKIVFDFGLGEVFCVECFREPFVHVHVSSAEDRT
ncbi:hypothetical protein GGX14DRAFT_404025 [Mycena pura]|uniref:Uncharacterized protein n=1 Tax=Mycena pura TaxID=153505 RepID=A0AAD6Y3W7_9AGAR|nr:hypothetical protein GGX14DRAFT_404025 [Mycena pura]